jgi:GAF domain-containing protein
MSAAVRETRGPVRLDYGDPAAGAIEFGARTSVAAPITVEGDLWGCISAASMNPERPPAPGTETRLSNFSELVATAIANAESREARAVLTEEQAALRRVATLVAQGARPAEIYATVGEEIGRLLVEGDYGRQVRRAVPHCRRWSRQRQRRDPTGSRWSR